MELKVSRVKRTKKKEVRGNTFRVNASLLSARSRHLWSGNVCADSQVSESQTFAKSSAEERIAEEPLVARSK